MIEFNEADQKELQVGDGFGVKVIGIGGAGANVLDRMALEGSDDAELLTLNTDVRALSTSVAADKIQLGESLLKGMGTGGDPSLGRQAALEAVDHIREAVRGQDMVFVCVGLGGGTGSGAAPEVCRIAREEGGFLAVFATIPFSFEGDRRTEQAKDALEAIGKYANAVVTFDNDRMGELIVPKDGVTQAFAAADRIISQSIRATMSLVYRPGIIRIGMDDLLSALQSKDSRCLFGYGHAKGDNRPFEAVEQALKCPLLDRGKLLNNAKSVLVQVAGDETMTLHEVRLVMEEINKHIGSETQVLFGTGNDTRLGNGLSVTIISSTGGSGKSVASASSSGVKAQEVDITIGDSPAVTAAPSRRAKAPEQAKPKVEAVPTRQERAARRMGQASAAVAAPAAAAPEPKSAVYESMGTDIQIEEQPTPKATAPAASGRIDISDNPTAPAKDPVPAQQSVPPAEPKSQAAEPAEEVSETKIPSLGSRSREISEETPRSSEEVTNPIARAVEQAKAPSDPEPGAAGPEDADSADRIEAVTESAQKISLSRLVSSGVTGKIKTRDASSAPVTGPVIVPTKAPPAADGEPSEEQQDLLNLEPASGQSKGRFAKTDPTIVDGEDLDVPTFLRKKR